MHGFTDEANPANSKLVFYNTQDTVEDGSLHAYELYNLRLNAQLAVLSACKTGTGKVQHGDGIMSLGRAFSFAGVPSLVLTRTDVSDAATPYIMQYFYEGLSKGLPKSKALQQAKVRFLENDADQITANPSYWASFYILGNDQPIVDTSNTNNLLFLVIGIGAAVGVAMAFKKKRKVQ